MTVVTAGAVALDMTGLDFDGLLHGSVTTKTSTTFTVTNGDRVDSFTGQGFVYAGDVPVGGTVTGVSEMLGGQPAFTVSGFSEPVTTVAFWVLNGLGQTALNALFDGPDTVTGSPLDDRLFTYAGADSLAGLGGNDLLVSGAGADSVTGGAGDDTITDEGGANSLAGGDGADVISGGDGFDRLNGNVGNDTVAGGRDDDWVSGGKNDDVLYGDEGNDTLNGNLGNDTMHGGDGADFVRGGQGNDVLFGGSGADTLSGDLGDDTLVGGEHADVFRAFAGGGADRILDFNADEGDRILLDPGTTYTVSQVGEDTVIDLGGGGATTLVGVNLSSLAAGWILGG